MEKVNVRYEEKKKPQEPSWLWGLYLYSVSPGVSKSSCDGSGICSTMSHGEHPHMLHIVSNSPHDGIP